MNLTAPQAVEAVHTAYALAGADILTANTFGASRRKLGEDPAPYIAAAVAIARRAAGPDAAGRREVPGVLGPALQPAQPLHQPPPGPVQPAQSSGRRGDPVHFGVAPAGGLGGRRRVGDAGALQPQKALALVFFDQVGDQGLHRAALYRRHRQVRRRQQKYPGGLGLRSGHGRSSKGQKVWLEALFAGGRTRQRRCRGAAARGLSPAF